jgi:hypothetical protein
VPVEKSVKKSVQRSVERSGATNLAGPTSTGPTAASWSAQSQQPSETFVARPHARAVSGHGSTQVNCAAPTGEGDERILRPALIIVPVEVRMESRIIAEKEALGQRSTAR